MDNMKKGSIRDKFIRLIIIVTFLAIIGGLSLLTTELFIHKEYTDQRQQLLDERSYFTAIDEQYDLMILSARGYYSFRSEFELERVYAAHRQLEELLRQSSKFPLGPEEETLLSSFQAFLEEYENYILPQAIKLVEADRRESLEALASEFKQQITDFLKFNQTKVATINEELITINEDYMFKTTVLEICLIIYIVVIFILLYVLSKRIYSNLVTPLEALSRASFQLQQGEYNLQLPSEREDEIGVLARSFMKMAESIQYKEEELSAQNEELQAQQLQLLDQQELIQASLQETEKSRYVLENMNSINQMLSTMVNKAELLKTTVDHLAHMYQLDKGMIVLLKSNRYASIGVSERQAEEYMQVVEQGVLLRLIEINTGHIVKRQAALFEQGLESEQVLCYDYYAPIFSANNEVIAMFIGSRIGREFEDNEVAELSGVLYRVSIAIERLRLYEETEEVRLLNQEIINNVNEGIQLVGLDGSILQINKMMSSMLGYSSSEQLFAKTLEDWAEVLKKKCKQDPGLELFLKEAVSKTNPSQLTYQYEITVPKKRVIEVYVESIVRDGKKIGTLFVHRDITTAFEVNQMKSELVSTVSHELRTPLSSILGFTELIITKDLKPERQRKYLETIHKEANRLTNLINDFLDLQRMEAGKQSYEMEIVVVQFLIEEMIETFKVNNRHHTFMIKSEDRNLNVMTDKTKLIQLFINLMSNAVKFSPQGGRITIQLEEKDGLIYIRIADEGLGIPSEEIPKLFQKFHRIDNSDRRKIGGTGLGLAICKEIAVSHGGDIAVESKLGQGSIFTVTLPALYLAASEFVAADREGQTGPTVVVLEDDISLALLLREELSESGFQVLHFTETQPAIQAIKVEVPHAVVVDLMIGTVVEGWSLVEEIKKDNATKDIPIIISSALDEKEKSKTFGVNSYLTKPYPPSKLSNVIVETLLRGMNKGDIMVPEE